MLLSSRGWTWPPAEALGRFATAQTFCFLSRCCRPCRAGSSARCGCPVQLPTATAGPQVVGDVGGEIGPRADAGDFDQAGSVRNDQPIRPSNLAPGSRDWVLQNRFDVLRQHRPGPDGPAPVVDRQTRWLGRSWLRPRWSLTDGCRHPLAGFAEVRLLSVTVEVGRGPFGVGGDLFRYAEKFRVRRLCASGFGARRITGPARPGLTRRRWPQPLEREVLREFWRRAELDRDEGADDFTWPRL